MCVPTATSSPCWLATSMSAVERRRTQVGRRNGVGHGDGVAEQHRLDEADAVVAGRNRRLGRLAGVGDGHRRNGGHETDQQRTVHHAGAETGALHVHLVDVIGREVAGDPGEQVDIGLADRLGELGALTHADIEIRSHCTPRVSSLAGSVGRPGAARQLRCSAYRTRRVWAGTGGHCLARRVGPFGGTMTLDLSGQTAVTAVGEVR